MKWCELARFFVTAAMGWQIGASEDEDIFGQD